MKSSFWAIAMMPLQSSNSRLRSGGEIVPMHMMEMERANEKLILSDCNAAVAIVHAASRGAKRGRGGVGGAPTMAILS